MAFRLNGFVSERGANSLKMAEHKVVIRGEGQAKKSLRSCFS